MHLHGHNFYVLHEGPGAWNGTIVRPSNPHRRDVQLVRGNGHLVIQFDGAPGASPLVVHEKLCSRSRLIQQTGIWAFHCHIAWHASGGFLSSLIVEPELVREMRIPRDIDRNCRAWDRWTKHNVVEQIDSGT